MGKIKIVTDSTSSLTIEECKKMDIECLQTTYVLDGEEHYAFDNEQESLLEFYEKLDKISSCSTGCVNEQTFEDCFDKYASKGNEVLYIGLSSYLSSTYSYSIKAAETINNKYGKRLVYCIDSRSGSYGILFLIEKAQELISQNKSLGQIEDILNSIAKNISVAFVCRDLSFLHKSGRIGRVEASIGKLLKIVPIVYVSEDGPLKTGDKCIGTKLAYKTLKNKFVQFIKNKNHTMCHITSCGLDEDAESLKKYIQENTNIKNIKVGYIDKTLACCCGPKTLAIFCG